VCITEKEEGAGLSPVSAAKGVQVRLVGVVGVGAVVGAVVVIVVVVVVVVVLIAAAATAVVGVIVGGVGVGVGAAGSPPGWYQVL